MAWLRTVLLEAMAWVAVSKTVKIKQMYSVRAKSTHCHPAQVASPDPMCSGKAGQKVEEESSHYLGQNTAVTWARKDIN